MKTCWHDRLETLSSTPLYTPSTACFVKCLRSSQSWICSLSLYIACDHLEPTNTHNPNRVLDHFKRLSRHIAYALRPAQSCHYPAIPEIGSICRKGCFVIPELRDTRALLAPAQALLTVLIFFDTIDQDSPFRLLVLSEPISYANFEWHRRRCTSRSDNRYLLPMLTAHRRPKKSDGLLALTAVTAESFSGQSDISYKPTCPL